MLYILENFLNLISTDILDSEVNWEATMIVVSRVLGNPNDDSQISQNASNDVDRMQ